jgi:putative DNA primase/helicase
MSGERTNNQEEQMFRLRGTRLAHATEPEQSKLWSGQRLKSLVQGKGSQLMVTPKYKPAVHFRETWKLFIDTNHDPRFRDTGDDIWERIKLIPFEYEIPKNKRDRDLGDKMAAELPGILSACVRGYQDFLENGLQEPADSLLSKSVVRRGSHPLNDLFEECHVISIPSDDMPDGELKIGTKELWMRYKSIYGNRTMQVRDFKSALLSAGVTEERSGSWRYYSGITFRND